MLVAITFDTHHFSISDRTVTDEEDDSPPPAKKARIDPFADMRDGNPTNKHEPTNHSRASGREELAEGDANPGRTQLISTGIFEGEWPRISTVG